jgi:hypothetical protein
MTGVSRWIDLLLDADFSGVVNLEVFTPEDLRTSLDILLRTLTDSADIICKKSKR